MLGVDVVVARLSSILLHSLMGFRSLEWDHHRYWLRYYKNELCGRGSNTRISLVSSMIVDVTWFCNPFIQTISIELCNMMSYDVVRWLLTLFTSQAFTTWFTLYTFRWISIQPITSIYSMGTIYLLILPNGPISLSTMSVLLRTLDTIVP